MDNHGKGGAGDCWKPRRDDLILPTVPGCEDLHQCKHGGRFSLAVARSFSRRGRGKVDVCID